ncbi:hypothetical protein SAMN02799643_04170 [Methylobacterium sp. UNCCL125]|jgi:hypothetical protein|nr:hypothetical protein SAMN02799643_04170 [Methylobacterium sp. UNCCL125]
MMDDRARLVRAFFEASATATRFGGRPASHLISLTRPGPRLRGARPRGYPHAHRDPAWWPVVEGGRVSRADKPARSKARRPPGSPSTSWSWTSSGPRPAAGQTWLKETASIQISPCDRGSYAEVVRPRSLAQGLDEKRKCIRVRVARQNIIFDAGIEFSPAGYGYRGENRNLFMVVASIGFSKADPRRSSRRRHFPAFCVGVEARPEPLVCPGEESPETCARPYRRMSALRTAVAVFSARSHRGRQNRPSARTRKPA